MVVQPPDSTVCACATALPATAALIRLSGPRAREVAARAGLALPMPWRQREAIWQLGPGPCPVRVAFFPAGRSYTGFDLVECVLPGAPDLVDLALHSLQDAGALPAAPGAFSRQALANGRIDLDQAQAVLALSQAPDAAAARSALQRLQGALGGELEPVRQGLLTTRALIEAGLDFLEEEDVSSYDPTALAADLREVAGVLHRWRRAVTSVGAEPVVCLVGPANAGKSALFACLTGSPALVSDEPGTTRDWLQAPLADSDRPVQVIDTAGWLDGERAGLDSAAIAVGRQRAAEAALVLACSAPDARLPDELPALGRLVVVATKADLGRPDTRASVAVSSHSGAGLAALRGLIDRAVAEACGGDRRQAALLDEAAALAAALAGNLPPDEILAADLRHLADLLGDLIGRTTDDEVLATIFGRFCIGK